MFFAFDPSCPFTRAVAPAWASWMRRVEKEDVDIWAVTGSARSVAVGFAEESQWVAPVVSLPGQLPESLVNAIVRRTPWIFVVDDEGVILLEGHGGQVSELLQGGWGLTGLGGS